VYGRVPRGFNETQSVHCWVRAFAVLELGSAVRNSLELYRLSFSLALIDRYPRSLSVSAACCADVVQPAAKSQLRGACRWLRTISTFFDFLLYSIPKLFFF